MLTFTFLFNDLMFFLVLIEHSYSIFLLDNDVRERRNVVYFLTILKFVKMFLTNVFTHFFIVKLNI